MLHFHTWWCWWWMHKLSDLSIECHFYILHTRFSKFITMIFYDIRLEKYETAYDESYYFSECTLFLNFILTASRIQLITLYIWKMPKCRAKWIFSIKFYVSMGFKYIVHYRICLSFFIKLYAIVKEAFAFLSKPFEINLFST